MVVIALVPVLLILAVLGMERLEARVLPGRPVPLDEDGQFPAGAALRDYPRGG